ncbi:MAG TPA: zinc ribbon domain-containing protein [Chthonomonadaceae bacterium]|nr:zinc ribbon domain-containing protein [Chthonomonadaceae bacterium]
MKCARCSAEIPSQSQFCLRCGAPVKGAAATSGGTAASMPRTVPRSNNRIAYLAGALLILLAAGAGLLAFRGQMTQKPGKSSSGTMVQAPGAGSGNGLVQAPGAAQNTPMVQAPGPTQNNADVDDYLKFVKKIEAQKQKLIKDELASALTNYAGLLGKEAAAVENEESQDQFLADIQKDSSNFPEAWDALTAEFNQRVPPASCQDLHDKYYDHLGKIQGEFQQIKNAVQKAFSNPSTAVNDLTHMEGKASQEADESAKSADDALTDVCSKYHLSKDFDITTDSTAFTPRLMPF